MTRADDDDDRWADLERRVAALEAAPPGAQARDHGRPLRGDGPAPPGEARTLWALEELRRQVAAQGLERGAVLFTGTVSTPAGPAEWQVGHAVDDLLADPGPQTLAAPAAALAALGSPVRLLLLLRVLEGAASAAELTDDDALGTSGQVYHHLRQLVAVGWLRPASRGRYAVPPERVVPLLVALALAGR